MVRWLPLESNPDVRLKLAFCHVEFSRILLVSYSFLHLSCSLLCVLLLSFTGKVMNKVSVYNVYIGSYCFHVKFS